MQTVVCMKALSVRSKANFQPGACICRWILRVYFARESDSGGDGYHTGELLVRKGQKGADVFSRVYDTLINNTSRPFRTKDDVVHVGGNNSPNRSLDDFLFRHHRRNG